MYSKSGMKQRVLLTGKDGIDLLQRISTLDFARVLPEVRQPGLILNPQGKILCYFEVERKAVPNQLEISFDDQFLELLERYTFSERYQIVHLDPMNSIEAQDSELQRILARIPKLGNEFLNNGETNPLEINLQSAIHDQKGCYPGQEVLEKIIAIGSPSKRLCLVKVIADERESSAGLEIKVPLELDDGVGRLTSFVAPYGLAIVRKTHAAANSVLHASQACVRLINLTNAE